MEQQCNFDGFPIFNLYIININCLFYENQTQILIFYWVLLWIWSIQKF